MEQFKKLKIAVVCYPTFGGSGVIATELGAYMAKQGHELHFITSSQPVKLDVFTHNVFFHEVSVKKYPLFKYEPYEIALTSKIVDIAKHESLDIIHVHYALPHASAAYMAKQILKAQGIDLPIVTTLHGTDITLVGKDPAFEPVITFSINQSDVVTAVSQSLKNDTLTHFKVENEISVVNNFVCVEKYKNRNEVCRKKFFAPNGEKILMHISNFRKVKRIQDIVKAFAIVQEKVPSKLLLIGDGPERSNVEVLVRELDLQKSVQFIGEIKEVESALCAADLFVLASESESFGLAALEAMAASVPVISTNTGGLPEVNIHAETGFLSAVGDFEKMASNILELLLNDDKRTLFSKNAFIRAEQFDIAKIAPAYLELYYKAINNIK